MDWRAALRLRMIADGAIAAASNGVSWTERPQTTDYPWLVMQVISDERPQHLKGFFGSARARVQFDALASNVEEAVALSNAALTAIAPAGTFSGIEFGRAMIEPRPDTGTQLVTGFVHRVSFDALFWHG